MSTSQNSVARRAAILIANTTGTPEEIAAALDAAGVLARPAAEVPGPYPLLVHTTALGAAIDVHSIVFALFRALAAEAAEDPEGVAEELAAIAEASPDGSGALLEVLTERLGGTEVRYGATAMRDLGARLLNAAGPVFPRQQNRRAG